MTRVRTTRQPQYECEDNIRGKIYKWGLELPLTESLKL